GDSQGIASFFLREWSDRERMGADQGKEELETAKRRATGDRLKVRRSGDDRNSRNRTRIGGSQRYERAAAPPFVRGGQPMPHDIGNVAFVGLGKMGSAMAANIAKAGFDLTVYNRTPEKMQPLLA